MKLERLLIAGALAWALGILATAAEARAIVDQRGANDPSIQGFTNTSGGAPVGSPARNAWSMTITEANVFAFSAADETELLNRPWALTVELANRTTPDGVGSGKGIYAGLNIGYHGYNIVLYADGRGGQVLNDLGSEDNSYTIANLGKKYVTFQMVFNPSTRTVNYYVNGALAIANDPGVQQRGAALDFGALGPATGDFRLLKLEVSHGSAH
jgi:hypothetical protein